MKNIVMILAIVSLMASCGQDRRPVLRYPLTPKHDVSESFFGTTVTDPYRWMEDDMSPETASWVKKQNELTFSYLDRIPYRNKIRERLTSLWNYERYQLPFREGDYLYYLKNDGLQNHYVLWRQKEGGEAEIFLDPNSFSEDGTTSLAELGFSSDGSLMAYSISEGGSDWRKIIVMDTRTGRQIGDVLSGIKFSRIAWQGNEGFYYSAYDRPGGSELSAVTDHHKLYFHRPGSPQSSDRLVFGGDLKRRYLSAWVSEDDHFLVVSASESTSGNELYIKDLTQRNADFICLADNFNNDHVFLGNVGRRLIISTNLNAPNTRIVSVDADDPDRGKWTDLIPETENVLIPAMGAGYIFANYMIDALSHTVQYDMEGNFIREIELPGPGTAAGFRGKSYDKELFFTFTSYISPLTIFRFEPRGGNTEVFRKPAVGFDGSGYESKQVFYTSKDGTRIPMMITYKKGIKLNGRNPALLYGYGGFNSSVLPAFSITSSVWLEMGGIYAVPNIRGGGEYGESWHLGGTKLNKQNVFDDFIAAAEYLIINGYTSSGYLAVRGGSNGGLLVGAVMTQRPALMKVALPAVGVLDMLRYHRFTAGAGWAYDYGTADDSKEMFDYLLGYSPVHNVRKTVRYPATLITTGDHDDRVVPAHSFKFAARLQERQTGRNPVLIRIETMAGHGAGTPVSKTIEELADIYGFTLWNMGIRDVDFGE